MALLTSFRQWLFRFGPDARLPIVLDRRRIFILPTGTGILYGVVLITMLLGAINYNLSLGHALVFLLAGLGFVAMVHTFRNLVDLRISPGRAEPVFAGETAQFRLIVDNPRPHERRALEFVIGDNPPSRLDLPQRAEAIVEIPCAARRRGRLAPGCVTLATRYPLGLFRAWSYPHPPLSCLVYPKPTHTPLPPHSGATDSGQRQSSLGQEDFTGLRLRRPNDSPRHIAWKAVARDIDGRPLLVKQFAGGAEGQLWLDWTLTPPELDAEARLSILCGWILAAEQRHLRYGLRLPGLQLAAAQGAPHRNACLEALALYDQANH